MGDPGDESDPAPAGGDLFDRWLAHREETTDASPRPRTYGVPRTGARAQAAPPVPPVPPLDQDE